MKDETYSLTVKCVVYMLIRVQRVGNVARDLQAESINKNYKFIQGENVCDGVHVTFSNIFTGVRTKRFQVLLPSIRYRCFRGLDALCWYLPYAPSGPTPQAEISVDVNVKF
jgi:hypothetical protein